MLQDYLIDRATAEGVPVIDEGALEPSLKRVMDVVLEAVGRVEEERGHQPSERGR